MTWGGLGLRADLPFEPVLDPLRISWLLTPATVVKLPGGLGTLWMDKRRCSFASVSRFMGGCGDEKVALADALNE